LANKQYSDVANKQTEIVEDVDKKAKIDTATKIIETDFEFDKKLNFDTNEPNVITLTEEQCIEIEQCLYEDVRDSINDSSELYAELEKYEQMYAMDPDHTKDNDPYPGASNIRSPYTAISVKGKLVRWTQSMFGVEPYGMIEPIEKSDAKLTVAGRIEEWLQFMFTKVMRAKKTYNDIFLNTGKLNTGIGMLSWRIDRSKVFEDNVEYTTSLSFRGDFPEQKKSGIDEAEYNDILARLDGGEVVKIPKVQKFKVTYNYPELQSVNRDNFVLIPANAKNLEIARGHGYETELNWNDLKRGEAEGRYINIDRVRKAAGSN
jgi:hypothetical protein